MNNVLMEDMEAMIHLFGVCHGRYGYLVRNIDIHCSESEHANILPKSL